MLKLFVFLAADYVVTILRLSKSTHTACNKAYMGKKMGFCDRFWGCFGSLSQMGEGVAYSWEEKREIPL